MTQAALPDRSLGPGGARLPAEARRRQLSAVAIEVFARKGFEATSMDDIAEAAGVTKPVLYHHFRSKRSLYLELLESVGARMLGSIDASVAGADGPRKQVEAGFTAYFRFVGENLSAFRLLFGSHARRDEDLVGVVSKVEQALADEVTSLIDADIDEEHRRVLAYAVVGMAEGASRHWLPPAAPPVGAPPVGGAGRQAKGRPLDPERMAQHLADLAWAGLRAVHRD